MRTLKFRVWSRRLNRMLYPTEICFNYDGRVTVYYGVDIDEKVIVSHEDVMQYTGLKDKDGKEIYEGDVIEGDTWKEPYAMRTKTKMRCEVVFRNGGFTSDWVKRLPKGFRTILMPQHSDCEVIGNIYEHPHLLTPDHKEPPQNAGAKNS